MKQIIQERGSVYCNSKSYSVLEETLSNYELRSIFIVVDSNTKKLCLPLLIDKIPILKSARVLEIGSGEAFKNISTCIKLWEDLSQKGADRNSIIINLGGGVVTDLGGFVASTFMRGIEFIHVPTTLLAMVDASVGGKNGIDLGVLKNQIGVINSPLLILIDTAYLNTLPYKEVRSGYAEMLKHGLIHSEKYWDKVQDLPLESISQNHELIWESILIKHEVVTNDPLEKGMRKALNYGHTLGHAIESYSLANRKMGALLHGEAIAIGMILATYFSTTLFDFPKVKLENISKFIIGHFSKVNFTTNEISEIINLLIYDKKNKNGKVQFVLLDDFGRPKFDIEVPNDLIYKGFAYYHDL